MELDQSHNINSHRAGIVPRSEGWFVVEIGGIEFAGRALHIWGPKVSFEDLKNGKQPLDVLIAPNEDTPHVYTVQEGVSASIMNAKGESIRSFYGPHTVIELVPPEV